MTPDHTFTDATGTSFSGAERMAAGWRHFFDTYPGYRIHIEHVFVREGIVGLFGSASGGWRDFPGRAWKIPAGWLAEVPGDRVRHWRVYCDTAWGKPPADA